MALNTLTMLSFNSDQIRHHISVLDSFLSFQSSTQKTSAVEGQAAYSHPTLILAGPPAVHSFVFVSHRVKNTCSLVCFPELVRSQGH